MRTTHGWAEIDAARKREIIAAIRTGTATRGPSHLELDLTDRCNVACYFCNQQDLRTKEQIPLPKLKSLLDELVGTGLKSVRLSGGGDPLFHREILPLLDYLAEKKVVIDNLTTNGVALNDEVAKRLVANKAREVIFSLNAADSADYHRMMAVKPALFDAVITNIRNLVAVRGESSYPGIVVQFLLDRPNATRVVDMYDLAASLGVDRIAINAVLEIPNDRVERERLLAPEDREMMRPYVEEVLRRDRDRGLLQIDFAIATWNTMLDEVRESAGAPAHNLFPTAASFKDENGGCFFSWYTAAVTGNGDIRPCCLMLNPSVKPLGNIHETETFGEQWNGPSFQRMRDEQRDVLLAGTKAEYSPEKHQVLQEYCVTPGHCWLKNMFFRGDEMFYAELNDALASTRPRPALPTRFTHTKHVLNRFVTSRPYVRVVYDKARDSSRPLRAFLKKRFGWNVTEAV
jgi:MoaA/NifB/PqqE/SkfB family radical SAM enzyme